MFKKQCSILIPLNPYIDEESILWVGGRLAHTANPRDQRYPTLLPSHHHMTHLFTSGEQLRLQHAGSPGPLYSIRQIYWALNG